MMTPEKQFAEQCTLAVSEDGTVEPDRLMGLVIEAYRRYQQQITLAEETMEIMRAANQKLAADLDATIAATLYSNSLFDIALQNMPIGLSLFDENGRLIAFSHQFCVQLGLPAEAVKPGVSFSSLRRLIRGVEKAVPARSTGGSKDAPGSADGNRTDYFEWKMEDHRTVQAIVSWIGDGRCVAVHRDITDEILAAERITHIAQHDPLTNLPNRTDFSRTVAGLLKQREAGEQVVMMLVNLDFFKTINDTLGLSTGDEILQQVALRLKDCSGENDIVARLGADEFAIVQTVRNTAESANLAHAISGQLVHPFMVAGAPITLSTSIGIAIAPINGNQVDMLLKNAGMALSRAKAEGRNTLRYFDPGMDARMQERRQLEADLRKAVQNHEFQLHYQPIYDVRANRVSALEALVRWNHPLRGRISPMDFIPLAEEMGLIVEIGRWVLYQACLDAAQWADTIRVSVNISAIQFKSADLLDDVMSALAMAGLAPERLDLEITESVLIQNRDQTLALLHDLKFHGISISMDDFGTGYSSLSYLRSFPFDKIKIDKSFVDDIADNGQALSIVRAIIFLGKTLGMTITVEGVETEEQFRLLQAEDCDEIQGYFISPPLPFSSTGAIMGFTQP